ncbi:MAG: TrkH family potassium uptake protein [Clostridia bacterium]|nr:TrkH family potassium uptake protein [Clostridia bacterium]
MNYKVIGLFIARILSFEALFLTPALGISVFNKEYPAAKGFLISMGIILLLAGALYLICRGAPSAFRAKEGLACVGVSWIVLSLLGCLPFYLSGEIPSYIDALFEMVSGFTTTGASVVPNVEVLSKGMLYWRSFSHWLGGMGVLVFLLAFIPASGSVHLLRAESPGPVVSKLVPKMKNSALLLYGMYIILSVLNLIFLLLGGMPLFDALCTMFGTAGTGGFGIKADSMAGYSPYLQNVTTVFMLLFGVNFGCYYLLILRRFKSFFKDEELRLYFGIVFASVAVIAINIYNIYGDIWETLRHSAFQVASIITTTGFATADFNLWPTLSKGILLCLMLVGACAGSTGGGIKCIRLLLILKGIRKSIQQVMSPRKVVAVRTNDTPVDDSTMAGVNSYLAAYAVILVGSFLLISIDGFSVETNVSAVVSCFNNIGPGLDLVGPVGNYSEFGILSKLVLIIDMLAGRLEIFPILALLSVSFKKSH